MADNYATHKHPQVKAWLACHQGFHLHFTPIYSSSSRTLVRAHYPTGDSQRFVPQPPAIGGQDRAVCSAHKRPFVRTATADSILAKVERICKLINGTEH
jgi:hypothetical protein